MSIFLMLVIFSGQVGHYIFYAFQQYQIREAVKYQLFAGIPDAALEIVVAEENDTFRWEEEGKEFYQQGQLYDVVKSVIKEGKTILYCINDKKEAALIKQFGKTEKSADNKAPKPTFKIQIIDFPVEPEDVLPKTSLVASPTYNRFDSAVIAFSKKVNAPPPRC